MSFILDALRKSEIERQRDAAPGLMRSPLATVRREIPAWSWILMVLLSLALAGLVAAWWFREPGVAETVAVAEQAALPPAAIPARAIETAPAGPASSAENPRRIQDLLRADPSLPPYSLGFLAYNPDPARAYALINGTRYVVGERLDSGPELVGIQPDGALLAYRGEFYLLTVR